MKTADVITHFGGVTPLAKAIGVKTQAISQWGEIVPELRAYQIEVLTGGKLKADPVKRPSVRIAPGTKPDDFLCVKRALAAKEQAEKE